MGNVAVQPGTTDPNTNLSNRVFSIPGVVCVTEPTPAGGRAVHAGAAAGWLEPSGIMQWSREVSVIARADLSELILQDLRLILPENRVLAIKYPRSHRAAKSAPLLAVSADVGKSLIEHGVRVHTIGFDRITGGLYLFGEGGGKDLVRLQGDLFQAIAPSLEAGDSRRDIDACLDGLVDRLLFEMTDGLLSEVTVELAASLPQLAPAGTDTVDLQEIESYLEETESKFSRFEAAAKETVSLLGKAALRGISKVEIPLFGEAVRDEQPMIALQMKIGDGGKTTFLQLPARERWLVTGELKDEAPRKVGDVREASALEAAEKAAAVKAAAEKAAAVKAAAEKAAAEKAAAEKAAAEKAAAAKAAAEKAAAGKAAAAKAAAEKVAKKAAAEKAAAKKKASKKKGGKKKSTRPAPREDEKPKPTTKEPSRQAAEPPPTPPVSEDKKGMYVGVAAVAIVLLLVALWAVFLRN